MEEISIGSTFGLAIKLYALMTPTAVLGAFIANTSHKTLTERYGIACRCALAIFILGEILLLFGLKIFNIFGFTLDAFRIGVGLLLFLSAIRLMNDDKDDMLPQKLKGDISVVPLAIPLGMGPSAIGTVMVLGAGATTTREILIFSASLLVASLGMAVLLCLADPVKKLLRQTGITVMGKLTALLLSAIAAQVIFSGIKGFIRHP